MSIFKRRKKKAGNGHSPEVDPLLRMDPEFKSATVTIRNGIELLDQQIEEKRLVQRAARKITQSVRDMDLRWSLGRVPHKAT